MPRYRAVLAVVLTAALVSAAAAEGGLGYASTATHHTASAISRIFSATPTRLHETLHSVPAADVSKRASKGGDNPAEHQYVKFVYICLFVHGPRDRDRDKRVTLFVPKSTAERLIKMGHATLGPC